MQSDFATFVPSGLEQKDRLLVVTLHQQYFVTDESIRDFASEMESIFERQCWRFIFDFQYVCYFPAECIMQLIQLCDMPRTKCVVLCNLNTVLAWAFHENEDIRDRFMMVATMRDALAAVKR